MNNRNRGRKGALTGTLVRLGTRQAVPLAFTTGLIALMWERIAGLDTAAIGASFSGTTLGQWELAAALTALSFWAVGRYDLVAHRLMGNPTPPGAASRAGAASIAVAQSVGFGLISGALMRWRLLPGLSLARSFALTALVAASFLAGWAVVAALATAIAPPALPGGTTQALLQPRSLALAVLALSGGFALLSLWRPSRLRWLPPLPATLALVALAALDTIAAGAALWVLLPPGTAPSLVAFLPAFLLALGAGLVSGSPGGVGPFEITLIALLPALPEPELLGSVLAFRVVYFAIPAVIGAAIAIRGPLRAREAALPRFEPDLAEDERAALTRQAPRAEAGLLAQPHLGLLRPAHALAPALMVARCPNTLVALLDPVRPGARPEVAFPLIAQAARTQARAPVLYKIGPRMAHAARTQGWLTLRISTEAWLDPRGWAPEGPAFRQLRRKLRKARDVEVEIITPASHHSLPLGQMQAVAEAWQQARGPARGFSMSHELRPQDLAHGRVALARHKGRLVAFASFHANAQEQTLDLVRIHPEAPDGTMHRLIAEAIRTAGAEGCPRLSLAAAPLPPRPEDALPLRLGRAVLARASGAAGLRQFKQSFAPNWQPLYLAAPGPLSLALGVIDLAHEITRPAAPTREPAPASVPDHAPSAPLAD